VGVPPPLLHTGQTPLTHTRVRPAPGCSVVTPREIRICPLPDPACYSIVRRGEGVPPPHLRKNRRGKGGPRLKNGRGIPPVLTISGPCWHDRIPDGYPGVKGTTSTNPVAGSAKGGVGVPPPPHAESWRGGPPPHLRAPLTLPGYRTPHATARASTTVRSVLL